MYFPCYLKLRAKRRHILKKRRSTIMINSLYGSFIQYVNLRCKGNSFPPHFQILGRFLRAHIFFVYGCAKITIIIGTNEEISKIILFLCPYDNILPYTPTMSHIPHTVATTQIRFWSNLWIQPKLAVSLHQI